MNIEKEAEDATKLIVGAWLDDAEARGYTLYRSDLIERYILQIAALQNKVAEMQTQINKLSEHRGD